MNQGWPESSASPSEGTKEMPDQQGVPSPDDPLPEPATDPDRHGSEDYAGHPIAGSNRTSESAQFRGRFRCFQRSATGREHQ